MAARLRVALGFALSIATLALALWILIPAPTYFLLTFGVGAPEVSAWLLVGALVGMGLVLADFQRRRPAQLAVLFGLVAITLALIPLAGFHATARDFEKRRRAMMGASDMVGLDSAMFLRQSPLVARDLFLGIPIGDARVTRGVVSGVVENRPLTIDICRPPRAGLFPTVVQIYGGAWQRGAPESHSNFCRWLAAAGYVVFAIDYRHAPRFHWPAQAEDMRADLAWIAAHAREYDADTSRVALIGRSAGAHLALMAAYTAGPVNVRGVVSYYGPTDLADAYENPPDPDPLRIRDVEVAFLGGPPSAMAERYRQASPLYAAGPGAPPTLLVYGARDHVVESRYGERLHQRLRAFGVPSAYLEIPWAEHAFDEVFNGPSSQLALYHTERFLAWVLSPRRAAP